MLYKRYVVQLVRVASNKIGCTETAKELVQDIFFDVLEKRELIDPDGSLKGYLFTALKNRVINYYRRDLLQRKYQQTIESEPLTEDVSQVLNKKEILGLLNSYIQKMPEKCRQVFLLRKEEYLSNKEIASQLGISVNTVEQHMRKAIRILKNSLVNYLHLLLAFYYLNYLFKDTIAFL